ncbi:MAG: helix-turn-helix domain-containing protein [Candidatus Omnitrophota bacterium]
MANEVTLTMNEAQKLGVIQETLAGRMTVKTAAGILQRSERQIYRLRLRIRKDGPLAIKDGNRSQPPAHARPVVKTSSRGFRNSKFFITMINLIGAKLKFQLLEILPPVHTTAYYIVKRQKFVFKEIKSKSTKKFLLFILTCNQMVA